jgi:hypothetical protein
MVALRAKFDGEKIELPTELRGAAPGDVLIVYPANEVQNPSTVTKQPSIWDAFGKAATQRSTAEINAQVQKERESWEER